MTQQKAASDLVSNMEHMPHREGGNLFFKGELKGIF